MVFYERSKSTKGNTGLVEIKDGEFLDLLRNEYYTNIKLYKNGAPLICGTVVNKSCAQRQFERKLKMYSAPFYSLL